MKRFLLGSLVCLLFSPGLSAQKNGIGNSLLWKVSGNGLEKPSYLFGTYHFLTNAFIDTLPNIKKAYYSADAVVGELIIDSTIQAPMMKASLLNGTTLKETLPDTLYTKASAWFKNEAGMDLSQLDQVNPVTLMTIALAITQQKYFAHNPKEIQLDTYFQDEAKKDGKRVMGLETIDVQIKALFQQLTLQRQVELLDETFKDEHSLRDLISIMTKAYVSQDMDALYKLMYGSSYRKEELKVLLDDRNEDWMKQLPDMMKKESLFVAVGALHLVGNSELVNQLKSLGYTVTPVKLRD